MSLQTRNERQIRNVSLGQTWKTGWQITTVQSEITLTFDDGDRELTVTPTGTVYYFIKNKRYELSEAKSIIIDDTEGLWYIYFNGLTLTASQTSWDWQLADICGVAMIHWNAANNTGNRVLWECHGFDMSASTHATKHHCEGMQYDAESAGLVVTAGGNPGQIGITEGDVHDEDIEIKITDGVGGGLFEQDIGDPAKLPVFWKTGASGLWRKVAATSYPFYDNAGADRVYYNQFTGGAWQRTELAPNKYTAYWVYIFNDKDEPILSIMGQTSYNTSAQAEDEAELDTLDLGTLPTAEIKVLYRLVIKSDGTIDSIKDYRIIGTPGGNYIPPPTVANNCRIFTGTYTGNGGNNRDIIDDDGSGTGTPLPFTPIAIKLMATAIVTIIERFKTNTMPGYFAWFDFSGATGYADNGCQIGTNKFTVNNNDVSDAWNKLNQVYHWVAWG
jgi:hypothetical protein